MYLVNRPIDWTVRTVRILWTANSPNSSHSANSSNNEQCEQLILCEQCERRTVRTVRSVRTTNSANSSYYANGANSEQCEQFTLGEQCERRTVRTVHFFKIVEQGEQVRTLFGGPWCRGETQVYRLYRSSVTEQRYMQPFLAVHLVYTSLTTYHLWCNSYNLHKLSTIHD